MLVSLVDHVAVFGDELERRVGVVAELAVVVERARELEIDGQVRVRRSIGIGRDDFEAGALRELVGQVPRGGRLVDTRAHFDIRGAIGSEVDLARVREREWSAAARAKREPGRKRNALRGAK